jgi:hypothetical protein
VGVTGPKPRHPHLAWAQASGYAGYAVDADSRVLVAVELADDAAQRAHFARLAALPAGARGAIEVAPQHRAALRQHRGIFVARARLGDVQGWVDAGHALQVVPALVGTGGEPRRPPAPQAPPSNADIAALLAMGEVEALQRRLRACATISSRPAPRAPARRGTTSVIVGVIDFGCPFAHRHLRRDTRSGWRTRIRHFWDQGRAAAGGPWRAVADFGHGREADAGALDRLMADVLREGPASERLREQNIYARAGLHELLGAGTHGAHVLDIAAGRAATDDAAAQADIVFVQLPEAAVLDLSGAWLTAQVIDAVHYIVARAQALNPAARIVINLSYGAAGGPHDGTSLLERALDELQAQAHTVLAAGNRPARAAVHAQAGSGGDARLHWHRPANDRTQSFLELWIDGDRLDRFQVAACGPDGRVLRIEGSGSANDPRGAGLFVDAPRPGVLRALLALAPSAATPGLAGVWTLELRALGRWQAHAWLERDEPARGARRPPPTAWLSAPAGSAFTADRACTLTALACGRHTLVVGGCVIDGTAVVGPDDEAAVGPTRDGRVGIAVLGPSARRVDGTLRGIVAAGNLSCAPQALRGTSMAAPWVARRLVNTLTSVAAGAAGATGANAAPRRRGNRRRASP